MLLIEIAAQGVRGVSPAGGTVRLRPGYNVVAADGPALRRLLEAMFHPTPRDGEALRAPGASGPLRAGLTVLGGDGATYRLVRDFAAGVQLSRFDPARRAFEPLPSDPSALEQLLADLALVPPRGRLALLGFAASDLPSRAGAPSANPAAPRRALTHPEAEKRLAELRDELGRSRRAEKLQYRLDGLQGRLFQADEVAKEEQRLRQARDATESALAAAAPVAAVAARLGDVDAKVAAYEKALAKRDEALARLAAEGALLDSPTTASPFWRTLRFWAGAGGGLAAAAAGVAGARAGHGLRYLALLDIPSFGWAAWVALRWVAAVEGQGRAERRRRIAEEHERKVIEAWERESAEVRGAMSDLGAPGLAELRDALRKLDAARGAAAQAQADLDTHAAHPETQAAREARARIQAELAEVEAGLAAEVGGYVRDPRSVEMEIQRLEAEAALAAADGEPAPTAATDPFDELLALAGRELGDSPHAVGLAAQARASQFLHALSAGRLAAAALDEHTHLLVTHGGRTVPAQALPPSDRDLAFIALRLALVERALAQWKGCALADDALQGFQEGGRRVAARILKQLARPGQLVHATSDPAFREFADHVT